MILAFVRIKTLRPCLSLFYIMSHNPKGDIEKHSWNGVTKDIV